MKFHLLNLAQSLMPFWLGRHAHSLEVVYELVLLGDGGLKSGLLYLTLLIGYPLLVQDLVTLNQLRVLLLHLLQQFHVCSLQLAQFSALGLNLK